MYNYIFIVTIGDYNCSGNSKSIKYTIKSSHKIDDVIKAYSNAITITGRDWPRAVANNGRNTVTNEELSALADIGFTPLSNSNVISESDIASIILLFIKVGNPDIQCCFADYAEDFNAQLVEHVGGGINFGSGC
jgi:hypothetical protein